MIYKTGNLIDISQEITFHHIGGSLEQRGWVEYWLKFFQYNFAIKFKRVESGGQWRFAYRSDTWNLAYVGPEGIARRDLTEWTINFNPLIFDYPRYRDLVIQHEIPHGFGLEHESLNPNEGPKWNKPVIIQRIMNSGKTLEEATANFEYWYENLDYSKYTYTQYNGYSIMAYGIDCKETLDNKLCGWVNYDIEPIFMNNLAEALGSPKREFLTPKYYRLLQDIDYKLD